MNCNRRKTAIVLSITLAIICICSRLRNFLCDPRLVGLGHHREIHQIGSLPQPEKFLASWSSVFLDTEANWRGNLDKVCRRSRISPEGGGWERGILQGVWVNKVENLIRNLCWSSQSSGCVGSHRPSHALNVCDSKFLSTSPISTFASQFTFFWVIGSPLRICLGVYLSCDRRDRLSLLTFNRLKWIIFFLTASGCIPSYPFPSARFISPSSSSSPPPARPCQFCFDQSCESKCI
jgi:hypothetical protein